MKNLYSNLSQKLAYGSTLLVVSVAANAAVPTYVTDALTSLSTQMTELATAYIPIAVLVVMAFLTPNIVLKIIQKLGRKAG